MTKVPMHLKDEKQTLDAYNNYGFVYGLAIGSVIGAIIAGPYFKEWSLFASLGTFFGCGIAGGVLGYLAIFIAHASYASGGGWGSSGGGGSSSTDGGGSLGSSDGGGDGGGSD